MGSSSHITLRTCCWAECRQVIQAGCKSWGATGLPYNGRENVAVQLSHAFASKATMIFPVPIFSFPVSCFVTAKHADDGDGILDWMV